MFHRYATGQGKTAAQAQARIRVSMLHYKLVTALVGYMQMAFISFAAFMWCTLNTSEACQHLFGLVCQTCCLIGIPGRGIGNKGNTSRPLTCQFVLDSACHETWHHSPAEMQSTVLL